MVESLLSEMIGVGDGMLRYKTFNSDQKLRRRVTAYGTGVSLKTRLWSVPAYRDNPW